MADQPAFDLAAAHKYFSAHCFNKAWDLIDQRERTSEENEEMIRLSLTALWHWTQRDDCTPQNLSVGYWQASRIYALMGQANNAKRYAQLSLEVSRAEDVPPFYRGYAYEALARAEMVAENRAQMEEYLMEARRLTEQVTDPEERKLLLNDLATIR